MRKNILLTSIASFCIGISAGLSTGTVYAADLAVSSKMDECSKELLLSYFPEKFVNSTLKRFNISEDKWAGINSALAARDKEIVKLVEKKAASLNPNPLKDPQQRQAAVKLFRETLLQVFTEALKSNDIQNVDQFQAMLDDIQQQKAKTFALCMEKQRELIKAGDKIEKDTQINDNADDDTDDEDSDDNDESDDDSDNDEDSDDDSDDESDDKSQSHDKQNDKKENVETKLK